MADSFSSANARLQKNIIALDGLAKEADLKGLVEDTGLRGEEMIDSHNREGKYFGGAYRDRPYSRTDLPLFFIGSFDRAPNGDYNVKSPRQNSSARIRSNDVRWTTSSTGRKTAWLRGGYSTWLRYTRPGKSLNKVDHQYTGAMLRNLTHDTRITPNRASIRWYVRSPHDKKAYYTHLRRNWMGLTEDEIQDIKTFAAREYGARIVDRLRD